MHLLLGISTVAQDQEHNVPYIHVDYWHKEYDLNKSVAKMNVKLGAKEAERIITKKNSIQRLKMEE